MAELEEKRATAESERLAAATTAHEEAERLAEATRKAEAEAKRLVALQIKQKEASEAAAAEQRRLESLAAQTKAEEERLAIIKTETDMAAAALAELERQQASEVQKTLDTQQAQLKAENQKVAEELKRLADEKRIAEAEMARLAEEKKTAEQAAQLAEAQGKTERIMQLLIDAQANLTALRLTTPEGNNAFEQFSAALGLNPNNTTAHEGLFQIADKYIELASQASERGDWDKAEAYLERANRVTPDNEAIDHARVSIEAQSKIALPDAVTLKPPDGEDSAQLLEQNVQPEQLDEQANHQSQQAAPVSSQPQLPQRKVHVGLVPFSARLSSTNWGKTLRGESIKLKQIIKNKIRMQAISFSIEAVLHDHSLNVHAPDNFRRDVIWRGFGSNQELNLERVMEGAKGLDVVVSALFDADWKSATLFVIDVKSGTIKAYPDGANEIDRITSTTLTQFLAAQSVPGKARLPTCIGHQTTTWDRCVGTHIDENDLTFVGEWRDGKRWTGIQYRKDRTALGTCQSRGYTASYGASSVAESDKLKSVKATRQTPDQAEASVEFTANSGQ